MSARIRKEQKNREMLLMFYCRRVLKNRPPPAGPQIDLNKLPLRISSSNKKESVHSVTGAIGKTNLNNMFNNFVVVLLV